MPSASASHANAFRPSCASPVSDAYVCEKPAARLRSAQTVWTTPGDNSTIVETKSSGNDFKVSAPGFGVILHDAGLTYADGTHHGVSAEFPFTPDVATTLCAALTS